MSDTINDFVGADELPTPKLTDFLRLESMRVYVPSEQERANWKNQEYIPAMLEFVYTPISYKIVNGLFGDKEVERYPVSWGLTAEDIEAVAKKGYFGIPLDKTKHNSGAKARSEFELVIRGFKAAGIDFGFSRSTGQPASAGTGHIIEMENAPRDIGSKNGYQPWVRIPLRIADDYKPGESIREVNRQRREDGATGYVAPVSTGPSKDVLAKAAAALGIIGQTPAELSSSATQMGLVSKARTIAPAFLHSDVAEAAANGELVDYLLSHGVLALDDDGRLVTN